MSFLLLHEMDAVDKKEWQLLFVLRRLPDAGALRWFVVLHLPLYAGLLVLAAAGPPTGAPWIQAGVDAFLLGHAGLHERLAQDGGRRFANPFSRTFIWGAALLGSAHLLTIATA